MTDDDITRALAYYTVTLRALSDALGDTMNAALAKNIKLDDPAVAHLPFIRAYVDGAITLLVQAQAHAQDTGLAGRLAEDFREMEGNDAGVPCQEIDRAAGTQETQD